MSADRQGVRVMRSLPATQHRKASGQRQKQRQGKEETFGIKSPAEQNNRSNSLPLSRKAVVYYKEVDQDSKLESTASIPVWSFLHCCTAILSVHS
eukprot:290467-Hanusia_phi.AAC.2